MKAPTFQLRSRHPELLTAAGSPDPLLRDLRRDVGELHRPAPLCMSCKLEATKPTVLSKLGALESLSYSASLDSLMGK